MHLSGVRQAPRDGQGARGAGLRATLGTCRHDISGLVHWRHAGSKKIPLVVHWDLDASAPASYYLAREAQTVHHDTKVLPRPTYSAPQAQKSLRSHRPTAPGSDFVLGGGFWSSRYRKAEGAYRMRDSGLASKGPPRPSPSNLMGSMGAGSGSSTPSARMTSMTSCRHSRATAPYPSTTL